MKSSRRLGNVINYTASHNRYKATGTVKYRRRSG